MSILASGKVAMGFLLTILNMGNIGSTAKWAIKEYKKFKFKKNF